MHLGLILPNFGEAASPERIRRAAVAAEELGFDSVWATEHILVGAEAVDPYGRVFAPLVTLGWIAAFTERVALGTSIVLAPLHHPVHLAKEAATLQELSGGRLKLGLGMGWHEDEFQNLGAEFRGRGRRAEEGIRLMRALWRGERSFAGRHWSFENATFAPLPDPEPELWFGGSADRAVRRALEHSGVWRPSRGGIRGESAPSRRSILSSRRSRERASRTSTPCSRWAPKESSLRCPTRRACATSFADTEVGGARQRPSPASSGSGMRCRGTGEVVRMGCWSARVCSSPVLCRCERILG